MAFLMLGCEQLSGFLLCLKQMQTLAFLDKYPEQFPSQRVTPVSYWGEMRSVFISWLQGDYSKIQR